MNSFIGPQPLVKEHQNPKFHNEIPVPKCRHEMGSTCALRIPTLPIWQIIPIRLRYKCRILRNGTCCSCDVVLSSGTDGDIRWDELSPIEEANSSPQEEKVEVLLQTYQPSWSAADICKTDMLEIDCQRTADDQIVVSHDNHLLRATGHDLLISDLEYAELPDYKSDLPLQFNPKLKCPSDSTDRKIPLLKEVFQTFPDLPMNIDIKEEDSKLLEKVSMNAAELVRYLKVSDLIEEFNRQDITAWGNFRESVCQKCYAKNPDIPLLFSVRKVVLLCLWFYSGLLPFIPIKESCLEILMPSVFLHLLMRPALFEHLQKRGIQVYAWVLNNEEEYQRAFGCGVDGIMTDFPTKLRTYLQENHLEKN